MKKILIVEDDPFLSKAAETILSDAGFSVDLKNDGEAGLKSIKGNQYDLVLLDLVLPKKSGFEVLRALEAAGNKTSVVVFSNLSQAKDQADCYELGAKGFYIKASLSAQDVIDIVKRHLA